MYYAGERGKVPKWFLLNAEIAQNAEDILGARYP